MNEDDVAPARYRFGPLERRGVVAGWRSGQIVAVAAGLLVAVAALRASPSVGGAALAVVAVATGIAVATWPIGGRSAEEWAPHAARHVVAGVDRARHRQPASIPDAALLDVDTGAGSMGVVWDRRRRTYTAVLRVSASGFTLLGEQDKAARLARWAGVLASTARPGSSVHRLQWIERAPGTPRPPAAGGVPVASADGDAGGRGDPGVAAPGEEARGLAAARASYDALCRAEAAPARHDVLLTVTVRAGRAVRAAGAGHAGACTVLGRDVAAVRRQLREAELDGDTLLDRPGVAAALRRGSAVDAAPAPAPEAWRCPWPMALRAEWGRLRTDGTWHVTYWVAEWPRLDVGPDFLSPLVLSSHVRRSLSVVMEPVGTAAAVRRIEQARTADVADAELRRRGGFLSTARRGRERATLARREMEIADGHAQFRFTGYVTVTAEDPQQLERDCEGVEQDAARCGIELRRCYGDQRNGWLSTLPLGFGLA